MVKIFGRNRFFHLYDDAGDRMSLVCADPFSRCVKRIASLLIGGDNGLQHLTVHGPVFFAQGLKNGFHRRPAALRINI